MLSARLGSGSVTFRPTAAGVEVEVDACVPGLADGPHGFHVHEYGDLRGGCDSTGGHYERHGRAHGARHGAARHDGDLGNVTSRGGCVRERFLASGLTAADLVGRAVVLHADEDDLGRGANAASAANGNAGARVACGVVGRAA